MLIEFASFSNLGPRSSNDDRLLAPFNKHDAEHIVAIADGIGGAAGGGEAATIAINAAKHVGPAPELLPTIFSSAVAAIKIRSDEVPEYARMGTTLSVAAILNGKIYVAHVGDTRIYHLRGKGLNSLTLGSDRNRRACSQRRIYRKSGQTLSSPQRPFVRSFYQERI
jgi:serine/threonine protein phosphatase PrpC